MLQNVPTLALTTLLLRQMEEAEKSGVPVYLHVEKGLVLRRLSASDLCAVLGALMDNAREAAEQSAAPYLSVELRNAQAATEVVVRNTYEETVGVSSFEASTKPGHQGLGLRSVREILGKYRNCYLFAHGGAVCGGANSDGIARKLQTVGFQRYPVWQSRPFWYNLP